MRSARRWVLAVLVLWAGQLIVLMDQLGDPTWSAYWHWRELYRPGIRIAETHAGGYVPGGTFNALSPTGARLAFVLSAGIYAVLAAAGLWAILALRRVVRAR